jgi:hypothetical protein
MVVVLGFTTYNLLKKNEAAEDIIISYLKFFENQTSTIIQIERKLDEIDSRGTFQSDDEIGWFWNELKKLKDNLSNFKINS